MEEISINSWTEIIEWFETNVTPKQDVTSSSIQFRGQADASWKLVPSLTRLILNDEDSILKASGYESHTKNDFVEQVHLLDSKMIYDLQNDPHSMLFDMQHYSCPTRLLDWSRSPYVALYFAVSELLSSDGALYVWDWRVYNFNHKLFYSILPPKNGDDVFSFTDHNIIEILFSTKPNERAARQQGSFSISNNIIKSHDDIITELSKNVKRSSGLYKLTISSELKLDFLERLKTMNITPLSLFPGLDGLGRSIKELLLIRQHRKA